MSYLKALLTKLYADGGISHCTHFNLATIKIKRHYFGLHLTALLHLIL